MDPLQHPYSKAIHLETIKQLLDFINSRTKSRTKYSYYNYHHNRDWINKELDELQAKDQAILDGLAQNHFHTTLARIARNWKHYQDLLEELQQQKVIRELMRKLPVEETTQVSAYDRTARREMQQILDIPANFTRAPTYGEWIRMKEEEDKDFDSFIYSLEGLTRYTEGEIKEPPMINIEWTSKYDSEHKRVKQVYREIKALLEEWLKKTSSDRSYIFQYVILDETG